MSYAHWFHQNGTDLVANIRVELVKGVFGRSSRLLITDGHIACHVAARLRPVRVAPQATRKVHVVCANTEHRGQGQTRAICPGQRTIV